MILGLTIGTSTIGWALLAADGKSLVAQGVRVFPSGTLGDVESGRDVSRNDRRQAARQHRAQLRRRAGRLTRLLKLLQRAGWLPPGADRHTVMAPLTGSPYALRTKALDEKLKPYELGRALYHLAHRRGFKPGRRQPLAAESAKEKELGVVKTAILELETAIRETGARTLGEYLHRLDPSIARRRRWTGRAMYVTELEAILASQARFHEISESLRKELAAIVFAQKPLRSQRGRVGRCTLESARKRMLLAHPVAQEFRVLQKVNDLRAVDDAGVETVVLTPFMRNTLLSHLRTHGDTTFAQVRKLLDLPKTVRFNFEREDEKKLLGDRTRATIGKIVALEEEKLTGVVEDLLSIEEEAGLHKRLVGHWGLDAEVADALANATLEAGHLMHAHKAVTRLLPLMRAGTPYATAVKSVYPHRMHTTNTAVRALPLVRQAYPYLANPLVGRALGELRKLMHAIMAKYGTPHSVRIELHRHLQSGPKRRRMASKRMRAVQQTKEEAAERLLTECGTTNPTQWQIERVLLADECKWRCPFTNKPISFRSLIREESNFHVVHLVPFGMSLDDDWRNKTLGHVSVTERRKTALLSELWTEGKEREAIDARFGELQGPFAKEKLRRFRLTREEAVREYDETYADRFLESSGYTARLAKEYLSKLYTSDAHVEATRGRITSFVREAIGLSRARREMGGDYRQHVFDAVAVALTNTQTVRALCTAAMVGERRRFGTFPAPWTSFVMDVTTAAHATVPSFRISKRVRGPLHEETCYGKRMTDAKGDYHLSRRSLSSMTKADVELVAGKRVQQTIIDALKGKDPRHVFADPTMLPTFNGHTLRSVRVRRREAAFAVGTGMETRLVTTEQNHHALVRMNCKGWVRDIIGLLEARRRLIAREPIFRREDAVLTIAPGELFEIDWQGKRRLIRVRSVSKDPRVSYVHVEDCRKMAELIEAKALHRESVDQLRMRQIQKVQVTVLGDLRRTAQVDGGGGMGGLSLRKRRVLGTG